MRWNHGKLSGRGDPSSEALRVGRIWGTLEENHVLGKLPGLSLLTQAPLLPRRGTEGQGYGKLLRQPPGLGAEAWGGARAGRVGEDASDRRHHMCKETGELLARGPAGR